jgi:hypothetical protein
MGIAIDVVLQGKVVSSKVCKQAAEIKSETCLHTNVGSKVVVSNLVTGPSCRVSPPS